MTRLSKIEKVIRLLRSNQVKTKDVTPCYLTDFISRRGINLTVDEVFHISNIYKLKPEENE
jgi:hypothetical protein